MFYTCIDFPIWPLSLAHCLIFLETSTHSMHNLCVYSCGRRWLWKKLKSDSVLKMILHQFCWLSLCIVQVMMGAALQRRLAGKGVVVSALHPGMVSAYIRIDVQPITANTICSIEKWTLYTFNNSTCFWYCTVVIQVSWLPVLYMLQSPYIFVVLSVTAFHGSLTQTKQRL